MQKLTKVLFPWLILGLFIPFTLSVKAETTVSKAQLPYEVLSINVEGDNLHISGWALAAYVQHFDTSSDHGVDIEFVSSIDNFRISAYGNGISQTKTMEYFGSPTCTYNLYFRSAEICNYHYDDVGFDAYIPLSKFKTGTIYQTNIIVHAYNAGVSYKTPLYFPLKNDLILTKNSKEFKIISRLDDTNLTVSATTVLARKEPYKTAPTWYLGFNCSTTYRNQLYFLKDTVYRNVFDKVVSDNTSFYQVSANLFICSNNRRRIVEGSQITPVWIASPYVLYSGSPLQIQVTQLNIAPTLTVHNTEIYEGDSFNYRNFINANDPEDGNITDKIILLSTNFSSAIGNYYYDLKVCDSAGACVTNRLWVLVKEIPNNLPEIYANDIELLINSTFNPLDHVSAFDVEDGNLSNSINTINYVDTAVLGIQQQCYEVYDSKGARTEKCINVNVIDYTTYANKFRFISKNYLFYQEEIPMNWITHIHALSDALNSTGYIYKFVIE